MQCFEEEFAHGKHIGFPVFVGCCLAVDVALSAVIHTLHHLLLTIQHIVRLLPENVTLEMILVVRFPRLRTHIAEVFATCARHEITTHRTLHSFPAPGTYLGILGDPLGISLLLDHLVHPLVLLITLTGVMIVTLAAEAEDLAAVAGNCLEG